MLRYAGGKSKAIKALLPFVPEGTCEIVSPFLGGGALELALAKRGVLVYGSDIDEPLVAFWETMKSDRAELVVRLRNLHPFTKDLYRECQAHLNDEDTPLNQAVRFFIVNRCCFSGCMTGGYSGARAPMSSIDALERVDLTNLRVQHCDYETALRQHPDVFAFLDPPYDVPNLYRSAEFDHARLARVLREREAPWVLCYNDTPRIRALYEDWCEIVPVSWQYGMNRSRSSNEIVVRRKRMELSPEREQECRTQDQSGTSTR